MKKKILIIGGAGFIGINVARKFIDGGWAVTILDNLSRRGTEYNLSWLEGVSAGKFAFVKADILKDQKKLRRYVQKTDVVLHLAAQVAVTTSIVDPRGDFYTNAGGTLNVLEAVRLSSRRPILIYASTNKVYGDLSDVRIEEHASRYKLSGLPFGISEKQQLDFHSPYGCSKGAAEQYVRDYSRIYGLKTVVFRQSCIYGEHQFGIEDQGWIAWFVIAALLKKPVTLYGSGKQVRDVLYVDDLVHAYEMAIRHIRSTSGQIYNIGGGATNSISILELLDTLHSDYNLEIKYVKQKTRPGDQKLFISDNRKLWREIGWKPRVDLETGVKRLIRWTTMNFELIKSLY